MKKNTHGFKERFKKATQQYNPIRMFRLTPSGFKIPMLPRVHFLPPPLNTLAGTTLACVSAIVLFHAACAALVHGGLLLVASVVCFTILQHVFGIQIQPRPM